jgi:predicted nucleic acid-binding protein
VSSARYLIDSSILIGNLRHQEIAHSMLHEIASSPCFVSVLTRVELLVGLRVLLGRETLELLRVFPSINVDADIADLAGRYGRQYKKTHARKTLDLMIAATARIHDLTLVTTNVRDFPMPELKLYPVSR